jgi:hypothetical protein
MEAKSEFLCLGQARVNKKLNSDCHELHYLQMALEKIGKAYVLRFGGAQIQSPQAPGE